MLNAEDHKMLCDMVANAGRIRVISTAGKKNAKQLIELGWRDPGNCMLAHRAARELGARTVAFFRGITYLDRIGPDGERRIERYMNSAAARRLIVAFDSGTQPITTDTTLTQARAFTQIRPDTGWPCSDRIEPCPRRREECQRQRGTNPETFGKPARGRQWLGTSPATDRALGKKPDASRGISI